MKYFKSATAIFSLCLLSYGWAKTIGPVGKLTINSVTECEGGGDYPVKLEAEIKNIGGGKKALNAKVVLPFKLDDSIKFRLDAKKWEGGGWKPNSYKVEGKLCEYLKKYIPKVWSKLSTAAKPSIKGFCPVDAGTYEVTNFQAEAKDLKIPAILYGKFLLKFTVQKGGKDVLCVMADANSDP